MKGKAMWTGGVSCTKDMWEEAWPTSAGIAVVSCCLNSRLSESVLGWLLCGVYGATPNSTILAKRAVRILLTYDELTAMMQAL
jgi:hypothetical protein